MPKVWQWNSFSGHNLCEPGDEALVPSFNYINPVKWTRSLDSASSSEGDVNDETQKKQQVVTSARFGLSPLSTRL